MYVVFAATIAASNSGLRNADTVKLLAAIWKPDDAPFGPFETAVSFNWIAT